MFRDILLLNDMNVVKSTKSNLKYVSKWSRWVEKYQFYLISVFAKSSYPILSFATFTKISLDFLNFSISQVNMISSTICIAL